MLVFLFWAQAEYLKSDLEAPDVLRNNIHYPETKNTSIGFT